MGIPDVVVLPVGRLVVEDHFKPLFIGTPLACLHPLLPLGREVAVEAAHDCDDVGRASTELADDPLDLGRGGATVVFVAVGNS